MKLNEDALVLLDIGGTKTQVCLVRGSVVSRWSRQPTVDGDADEVLAGVLDQIECLVGNDLEMVRGAGIAVAGMVDERRGTVLRAANLPFENYPLRDLIAARLDVATVIEEDANAAALAEHFVRDSAPGAITCYVTVSTGIGMGVVHDGEILRGGEYGLGEIGHMIVDPNSAVQCQCGRRGCLEALASGRALHTHDSCRTTDCLVDGQSSRGPGVVECAAHGDSAAIAVAAHASRYLGHALDTVRQIFDPESLILGGGLIESDYMFEAIQHDYVELRALAGHGPHNLTRSQMKGWGPIFGMAKLVRPDLPALQAPDIPTQTAAVAE